MISFNIVILLCAVTLADSYHVSRHKRHLLEDHVASATTTAESSTAMHNHTRPSLNTSTLESSVTTPVPNGSLHQTTADVAVAVIIIIVIIVILGMGIYFIRKFDQLNKMVPTYRYSSLKTEVNGVNGMDDKIESQYLVCASTEEEDFEDEEVPSAPTLVVHSQTTLGGGKGDSSGSGLPHNSVTSTVPKSASEIKKIIATDSDDELLQ